MPIYVVPITLEKLRIQFGETDHEQRADTHDTECVPDRCDPVHRQERRDKQTERDHDQVVADKTDHRIFRLVTNDRAGKHADKVDH